MFQSVKLAKKIVLGAHFLLIILFFSAAAKAQVTGGVGLTIQPDGRILIYGNNLTVNGASQSIARLNRDGVPETSFGYYDSTFSINSAVVQSDNKIIIAGSKSNEYGNGALVRRLNSNGTIDSTFPEYYLAANPSGAKFIATIWAAQADDKIIISVETAVFGTLGYDVRRLARNGGLDSTFSTIQVSASGIQTAFYITKVALQADEKILITSRPLFLTSQSASVRRYLQDGTLDSTFTPPPIGSTTTYTYLNDVIAGADGGIVIGGSFQQVSSVDRNNLAKLQATGSLDTSFTSPLGTGATSGGSGDEVRRIAFASNNQIIVSTANRFFKLNANGTIDNTFASPSALTQINVWRSDGTGRIVFIGTVVENGSPVTRLRRLNTDGSLDNSFSIRRSPFDFDGDGRADVSVFRPSTGYWYTSPNPATNYGAVLFGQQGDKLVPADYDGDGKTDVAVVRNGTWYLQRSSLGFTGTLFGNPDDVPVPADYDGDGKADLAVFRPSNGTWYLLQSQAGYTAVALGLGTDKPVPGDYNGDGRAEVAVFRPSNGYWYRSTNPATGYGGIPFGQAEDKPVPADYDGDGRTDLAVFRPSNGTWYLLQSTAGFTGIAFGFGTDLPTPADYDGDGRADIAVFRSGNWYLSRTTQGFTAIQFGVSTDLPVPNSFVR